MAELGQLKPEYRSCFQFACMDTGAQIFRSSSAIFLNALAETWIKVEESEPELVPTWAASTQGHGFTRWTTTLIPAMPFSKCTAMLYQYDSSINSSIIHLLLNHIFFHNEQIILSHARSTFNSIFKTKDKLLSSQAWIYSNSLLASVFLHAVWDIY